MDIITGALMAASAPAVSPLNAAVSPSAAPESRASARFAELMAGGGLEEARGASAAVSVAPAAVSDAPLAVAGKESLGDRILNGLSGASSDFQQSLGKVRGVLDAGNQMSPTDLLKLQLNLTQVSIQYDLIGKAISRTTQNIDQMVKIQ